MALESQCDSLYGRSGMSWTAPNEVDASHRSHGRLEGVAPHSEQLCVKANIRTDILTGAETGWRPIRSRPTALEQRERFRCCGLNAVGKQAIREQQKAAVLTIHQGVYEHAIPLAPSVRRAREAECRHYTKHEHMRDTRKQHRDRTYSAPRGFDYQWLWPRQ